MENNIVEDSSNNQAAAVKKQHRRGKRKRAAESSGKNDEQVGESSMVNDNEQINEDHQHEDSFPSVLAQFGRVPEETLTYFRNIEPMLSEEALADKDAEERHLFIQNIYSEVDGQELNLATEYTCSRILEKLIRVSEPFHYRVFMDRMRGQFFPLITNRFGSHVMQTLLSVSAKVFENDEQQQQQQQQDPSTNDQDGGTDGVLLPLRDLFINMCTELQPYWTSLLVDTYGSHILRLILNILSGNKLLANPDTADLIRSKSSKKYHDTHQIQTDENQILKNELIDVPEVFSEKLGEIAFGLVDGMSEVEIRTLSCHAVANPVFQSILLLHKDNQPLCDSLVDKLLLGVSTKQKDQPHPADDLINTMLHSQIGSHLLEKIIQSISPPLFTTLFENYFSGKMMGLAMDPVSNYVLQSIIHHSPTPSQTTHTIHELGPQLKQLLFRGRINVVHKLIEAGVRNGGDLGVLKKFVLGGFEIRTKEDQRMAVPVMLALQTVDEYGRQRRGYQFGGARLIQQMLEFPDDHNIFLIGSFLSMTDDERTQLAMDRTASRVVESFLTSPQVGPKVKKKILRGFQSRYAQLAKDKYGSHLVDKCWSVADVKQKIAIAEELLDAEKDLSPNFHARFILRNCRIDQFRRRREEWVAREEGIYKKRALFSDFLGEGLMVNGGEGVKKEQQQQQQQKVEVDKLAPSHIAKTKTDVPEDLGIIMDAIVAANPDKESQKKKKKKEKGEGKDREEKREKKKSKKSSSMVDNDEQPMKMKKVRSE